MTTRIGIAYRSELRNFLLRRELPVDHVEIAVEYAYDGRSANREVLDLLGLYDICLHSASLSFASREAPSRAWTMQAVARLSDQLNPLWVGDHASFTGTGAFNTMQLLPPLRTEAVAQVVAHNVRHLAEVSGRPVLLEYATAHYDLGGTLSEGEFLDAALGGSGAGLLLDLHNVYCNALNGGIDPVRLLHSLPLHRTVQVHVAGGRAANGRYFDSHDRPVPEPVWLLLEELLTVVAPRSILLERDGGLEDVAGIHNDLRRAHEIVSQARVLDHGRLEWPLSSSREADSNAETSMERIVYYLCCQGAIPPELQELEPALLLYRNGVRKRIFGTVQNVCRHSFPYLADFLKVDWATLIAGLAASPNPLAGVKAVEGKIRAHLPVDVRWLLDLDIAVAELDYGEVSSRVVIDHARQQTYSITVDENRIARVQPIEATGGL